MAHALCAASRHLERPWELRLDGCRSLFCPERISHRLAASTSLYARQPAFHRRLLYASRLPRPAGLPDRSAFLLRHPWVPRSARTLASLAVSYLHGKLPHQLCQRPSFLSRLVSLRGRAFLSGTALIDLAAHAPAEFWQGANHDSGNSLFWHRPPRLHLSPSGGNLPPRRRRLRAGLRGKNLLSHAHPARRSFGRCDSGHHQDFPPCVVAACHDPRLPIAGKRTRALCLGHVAFQRPSFVFSLSHWFPFAGCWPWPADRHQHRSVQSALQSPRIRTDRGPCLQRLSHAQRGHPHGSHTLATAD